MINKDLTINKELCISCGACKLICELENRENSCLDMKEEKNYRFTPEINKSKCQKCFKCYSVCPIQKGKMRSLISKYSYGDKEKKCYVGYSNDIDHRGSSATGGVATQVIKDSLNNNIIDAALMTRGLSNGNFEVVLVRSAEEVDTCKGSIYRPVNLLANIEKHILNSEFKKIAIVGLPCHIHGIKNISKLNKLVEEKIIFTISIFCKQTKEKGYTDFIKYLTNFKEKEWKIRYRSNGWPGNTIIRNNNGDVVKKIESNSSKLSTLWGMNTFTPIGCFLCSDPLGEVADISLGDAWLKEYMENDNLGTELILVNTQNGLNILNKCSNIKKEPEKFENILESQSKQLINYKRNINIDRWNEIIIYSKNKSTKSIKSKKLKFYIDGKNISEKSLFLKFTKKLPSKVLRIFIMTRQKIFNSFYKV